jgi:hypothetical protein
MTSTTRSRSTGADEHARRRSAQIAFWNARDIADLIPEEEEL